MVKFITPVSMQVTQEQFIKDLEQPLKDLGYNINVASFGAYRILVNNSQNCLGYVNNLGTDKKLNHERYFIDHYNPELFLALAAMTNEKYGIVGEYWMCIKSSTSFTDFTDNKLYKCVRIDIKDGLPLFKDNRDRINGYDGQTLNQYFRKATKEEIIKHFAKMNKETRIIGYKLVKPEYAGAALKIANRLVNSVVHITSECLNNIEIKKRAVSISNLKKAGVLDLWFEPVYEKEYKLPKINGYEGKLEGSLVVYGCVEITPAVFEKMGSRLIKTLTFDSGVTITEQEMNQIREYLSKNKPL